MCVMRACAPPTLLAPAPPIRLSTARVEGDQCRQRRSRVKTPPPCGRSRSWGRSLACPAFGPSSVESLKKKPYLDGWCSCVFWTLYVTLDVERERDGHLFSFSVLVCVTPEEEVGRGWLGLFFFFYPPILHYKHAVCVCVCMVVEKSLQVDHCSRGRQWSASSRPRRTLLLRRPTVGALSLFIFFSFHFTISHTPRLLPSSFLTHLCISNLTHHVPTF